MKVTLPDGTTVEGSYDEVKDYLPPVPIRNWDGSIKVTCDVAKGDAEGVETTVGCDGVPKTDAGGYVQARPGCVESRSNSGTCTKTLPNGHRLIIETCPDGRNERRTEVDEQGFVVSQCETLLAVPRKFVPFDLGHASNAPLS